ncbi:hypothetical protein LTR36_001079 [Oleoguttula mirabilis]|uniref:Uncharacterized protein n=1 Tax=Oleoguttula mirabilis TaxID=1507867 RepID=A0AAV9JSC7_9PEZI|nr:hypothetical protein LTR36_001079 [Oleoguttula mirabilis]
MRVCTTGAGDASTITLCKEITSTIVHHARGFGPAVAEATETSSPVSTDVSIEARDAVDEVSLTTSVSMPTSAPAGTQSDHHGHKMPGNHSNWDFDRSHPHGEATGTHSDRHGHETSGNHSSWDFSRPHHHGEPTGTDGKPQDRFTHGMFHGETATPHITFSTGYKAIAAREALSPQPLSETKTTSSSHRPTEHTSLNTSSTDRLPPAFPFSAVEGLPSTGRIEADLTTLTSKTLTTVKSTTTEHGALSIETRTETLLITETSLRVETTTVHLTASRTVTSDLGTYFGPAMYDTSAQAGRSTWTATPASAESIQAADTGIDRGGPPTDTTTATTQSSTSSTKSSTSSTKSSTSSTKSSTSSTKSSTSSSRHPGQTGPPALAEHSILPLDKLWGQLNKDTIYAAYFIPLTISADELVAAHVHDLNKITIGFGSDKQPTSEHSETTTSSEHSPSTISSEHNRTTSSSEHSSSTTRLIAPPTDTAPITASSLHSCEPKTVVKTITKMTTNGAADHDTFTIFTTTMALPRTHEHGTGSCVTVKSTTSRKTTESTALSTSTSSHSSHSSSSKSTLVVTSTTPSWNGTSMNSLTEPAGGSTAPVSMQDDTDDSEYWASVSETQILSSTTVAAATNEGDAWMGTGTVTAVPSSETSYQDGTPTSASDAGSGVPTVDQ